MRPRLGVALLSRLLGLALSPGNRRVCVGEFMGFFNSLLESPVGDSCALYHWHKCQPKARAEGRGVYPRK
jgi:hypothetical protein